MIKLTTVVLIILSSVFLGCIQQPVETPTATPTATETVRPTVVPTTPGPTPTLTPAPTLTPTPKLFPITYKVWIDSDYGFRLVRAFNGTSSIPLQSDFNILNFTINVGDKVRWINDDSYDFPLTVISNEGLWTNQTGYLRYSSTAFEYTFNKTGTYTFSIKEAARKPYQKIIVTS